jgi:hypothetical protein
VFGGKLVGRKADIVMPPQCIISHPAPILINRPENSPLDSTGLAEL